MVGAGPARRARSRRWGAVALVLVAAMVAVPVSAQRRDLRGEQRRLQETQKRLGEQRAKAEGARKREKSVLVELEQVGRRLAEKRREVGKLDARIKSVQSDVAVLLADIGKLERSRADQEALLARRVRAIYKIHAQGGALPLILAGGDPVERALAVRHLASLAALDARLIQEYRETTEKLGDRRVRAQTQGEELKGLRTAVAREGAAADREAAARRALLSKVRDERAYHERMVEELTEASQRLEAFVRELQAKQRQAAARAAARATPPKVVAPAPGPAPAPPPGWRGRLPWPTDGRVAAAFGVQVHPRFGTRTFRNGVDIESTEGRAVHAVLAGQVIYAGWFRGYGNLIIVDHGNELFTLYAHVSEIDVKEADEVRQGQRIGVVGDTGSLAKPGLYFEVRYRGRPQDPDEWLRQRG
jgi:septal ring factor EnvC (AmiA/AmiB activator)